MSGVDRMSLIAHLTDAMQTLHAEDQRLQVVLSNVRRTRAVGPEEWEALASAQRTALRIPANSLLMLAGFLEALPAQEGRARSEGEEGERSAAPTKNRLRRALRALSRLL